MPAKKSDRFSDDVICPLGNESHSEHDRVILKAHDQVMRADEAVKQATIRIKELEANMLMPEPNEKDRTSQVLAQRVYDLQKQNEYLRKRLGMKEER